MSDAQLGQCPAVLRDFSCLVFPGGARYLTEDAPPGSPPSPHPTRVFQVSPEPHVFSDLSRSVRYLPARASDVGTAVPGVSRLVQVGARCAEGCLQPGTGCSS